MKLFPVKVHLLVLFSGLAALSWEVLWQVKSTLALGISEQGTALTLATTMGGMSLGALMMGHFLRNKTSVRPLRIYGILEIIVGLAGLLLTCAFNLIREFDIQVYASMPAQAPLIHVFSIVAALGIPTWCLGATLPVIGLAAQQHKTPLSLLYGLNTLGAAAGTLLCAMLFIPLFGVSGTIIGVAIINIIVGFIAIAQGADVFHPQENKTVAATETTPNIPFAQALLLVFVPGFVTFELEVAWFRSFTSTFFSMSDSFALMLASVLIALGLAARFVSSLRNRNAPLGTWICSAGVFILVTTPFVERFDILSFYTFNPILTILARFTAAFYAIAPAVLCLGLVLPWILDEQDTPKRWGIMYGVNALAAIIGSISAGWVLLPMLGFARTAWLCGIIVVATGFILLPKQQRALFASLGCIALLCAMTFESGVGRTRVQSNMSSKENEFKIMDFYEGPDATVSVVEDKKGIRRLVINGFMATSQSIDKSDTQFEHYMAWMGHMPMILHPDPKTALVICFGTGQTANAVRVENPERLDIAELSKHVLSMAHLFSANQGVLEDSRVHPTIMDGRAFLRRTNKTYDVITLEPMPPFFAGVNALYSKEFYELAHSKMSDDGVIAQWMPFHLVSVHGAASIIKTFQSVFPNATLWIDPPSTTGIILGSKDETADITKDLPGLKRKGIPRDLTEKEIRDGFRLYRDTLAQYGAYGDIVSDDNQLLSYVESLYHGKRDTRIKNLENGDLVKKIVEANQ